MAKVYGVHELELRPGVKPEEFECFLAQVPELGDGLVGWTHHVLKGERGVRKGKYLLLIEIESLAARNRYAPHEHGPFSEELEEIVRREAPYWDQWRALATVPGEDSVITDYVELG